MFYDGPCGLPWDCTGFIEYISLLLLWTSELSVCTLLISSVTWKCDMALLTTGQLHPLKSLIQTMFYLTA